MFPLAPYTHHLHHLLSRHNQPSRRVVPHQPFCAATVLLYPVLHPSPPPLTCPSIVERRRALPLPSPPCLRLLSRTAIEAMPSMASEAPDTNITRPQTPSKPNELIGSADLPVSNVSRPFAPPTRTKATTPMPHNPRPLPRPPSRLQPQPPASRQPSSIRTDSRQLLLR